MAVFGRILSDSHLPKLLDLLRGFLIQVLLAILSWNSSPRRFSNAPWQNRHRMT